MSNWLWSDTHTGRVFQLASLMACTAMVSITLLTGRATGQVRESERASPTRLTESMVDLAHPFDSAETASPEWLPGDGGPWLAEQLWGVLQLHQEGQLDRAERAWLEMNLPNDSEVWRQLGIAMCELTQGNLGAAELSLETARLLSPSNPIVHYLLGVYNITRAGDANPDDIRSISSPIRLATANLASGAEEDSRISTMLRAEHHFKQAIVLSGSVCLEASLVPIELAGPMEGVPAPAVTTDPAAQSKVLPNLQDYLTAIGCGNYVARSHLGLGHVYLELNTLEHAEEQLTEASALGLGVQAEWLQLGAAYDGSNQHFDAVRAYLKAMGRGHSVIQPLREAFRTVAKACK